MADTTANPNPTATAGNNTAGGSKTADGQQPPNTEAPKPNTGNAAPKAKLAPPRKPEPAPEPADEEMQEDAEGEGEGEEDEEEEPPKKTPEPVKKPLQKDAEKKKEPEKKKEDTTANSKKVAEPAKKAAPNQDAEMKDAPADTKASENPVKDALSKFAAADPKNAEVVVSLLSQLNELKSESAKLREERAAEKAEREAEKARVEQARLKEASAKHDYWAKNIDSLVPDVSAEEKDMVKQIFESDPNEVGNKTLERLIDRLTEALATTREEAIQHKKSRASSEASPNTLNEDQLKSALEQLSNEFGGGSTPKQPADTDVKRKKSVSLKEPAAPRTPGPTEIMVRHNKALSGLDSKSATAKALMAFGDRTDLDINGHHAMLAKKIDEVRARKAQLNA